jgi:phosphoribosylformimino-5-aminoimidazole carboxamide ribotide isomerase
MRILGVLDLLGGRAVHAAGGRRDRYEPVRAVRRTDSPARTHLPEGTQIRRPYADGDAVGLAHWYVRDLGIEELYAADLDAIQGRPPQDAVVAALGEIGAPLWLDAGISTLGAARSALERAAAVVVVGLETLPSYGALAEICTVAGGDRVAFSLDLRDGEPVFGRGITREPPHVVASRASDAGAGAIIVLDLARVGTESGLDLPLLTRIRKTVPGVTLLAGGGVGGMDDLLRLADAGCEGALVATALQDGRLSRDDLSDAKKRQRSPSR